MVDWTEVITGIASILITGGGITVIATIKDKKYEAVQNNILKLIESVSKTNNAWEKITEQKSDDIREARKDIEAKDAKIDSLYSTISHLRNELDTKRTEAAVLQVIKCKIMGCEKREPPLGEKLPACIIENHYEDKQRRSGAH